MNIKPCNFTPDHLLEAFMQSDIATAIYEGDDINICFANHAMLSFWGKDETVIGKTLLDGVPELRDQPFKKMLQNVLNTGITDSGIIPASTLINGSLQTAFYDYQYRRITVGPDNLFCIIHTAKDVTHHHVSEQQNKELSASLSTLNHDVNVANKHLLETNYKLEKIQHELKNTISQLEESEISLKLAIEAADFGTWHIHSVTRHFITTPRLRELFGYFADEEITIEQALAQITEEYRTDVTIALENAIYNGGDYDVTYPVIGFHDQKLRWLRAIGNLKVNPAGEYSEFTGVVMDVSDLKKEEQRKNDFIAMVSHELKTPLTSINGFLQIIQSKVASGNVSSIAGMLTKLLKSTRRMTTMINGFLTVSKLESGKLQLDKQQFDLFDFLEEIKDEIEILHPSNNFIFHNLISIIIEADRDKIGHVLTNLISNACKYSDPHSEITISCTKTSETAIISVKDAGIGIKEKDLPKLFERYYRVSDTTNIAGFGIGLYLSANIIERHDGKIWAESKPGEGSTFFFSIPL